MSKQIRLSLIALTTLYLLFELSFSARLLDVLGSQYNQDIHGLEMYGRIFSGFAFSLIFFKLIFDNDLFSFGAKMLQMLTVVALSITMMWFLQDWVINKIKSNYTVEERAKLAYLSLSSGLIASGEMKVDGLSQTDIQDSPNAFKAFVALYPYLYQNNEKQNNFSAETKDKILTYQVTSSCDLNESVRCLGDLDSFHEKVWMPLRRSVINKIDQDIAQYYEKLSSETISKVAKQGWQDYVDDVRTKMARSPAEIKRHMVYRNRVSASVVKNLSPYLAKGWQVDDAKEFKRAYGKKYVDSVRAETQKLFKASLPSKITTSWVFAQKETQRKINEKFGITASTEHHTNGLIKFDHNATSKAQSAKFYYQLVSHYKKVNQPLDDISNLHHRSMYGEQYLDRVIIPFVALLFSLAGGLLHVVKLSVMTTGLITDKARNKLIVIGAMLMIAFITPLVISNNITRSSAFEAIAQEHGKIKGYSVRWVINAQQLVYPVNHFIRKYVMRDIRFEFSRYQRDSVASPTRERSD